MNEQFSTFQVTDRKSFIQFLDLLRQDFLKNPNGWENNKLDTFLDALSSYTNDVQGYYENMGQQVDLEKPSWQTFADIFKGATMYE